MHPGTTPHISELWPGFCHGQSLAPRNLRFSLNLAGAWDAHSSRPNEIWHLKAVCKEWSVWLPVVVREAEIKMQMSWRFVWPTGKRQKGKKTACAKWLLRQTGLHVEWKTSMSDDSVISWLLCKWSPPIPLLHPQVVVKLGRGVFSRRLYLPKVKVDSATPKRLLCKELWWRKTLELWHLLWLWPGSKSPLPLTGQKDTKGTKGSCHVGEGVLGNRLVGILLAMQLCTRLKSWRYIVNSLHPRYHHRSQKLHKDANHNSTKDRAHRSHGSLEG